MPSTPDVPPRHTTTRPSRRRFLGGAAGAAAAAGLVAALPGTAAADAAEATAAARAKRTRSLDDIEHVVILMQENRSVDHYYGTMRGVRGYADNTVLRLPGGRTPFQQPDPTRPDGGILLPFHADTSRFDGQDLTGNDHSWGGVHEQWATGANTGFVVDSGEQTMAYFTEGDVPFNRALAKSFTFCDHYFCSIKGPTTPNRLYHWSGTVDPHGEAGGPANYNPDDYNPVFRWTTYPERLQQAGISWQVFANDEVGDGGGEDGYVGDYGDNPLWLFQAYHDALASSDPKVRQLAERASLRTTWKPNSGLGHDVDHVLAQFLDTVRTGTLPAVSWIVAPYAYSEHPAARPVDGAAYVQTVLNAIWSKPELWAKTAILLNYDEHDGFFDHVIPPTAPDGTADEFIQGLPIGMGPRVPMTVVSPWSAGGWINSQVHDHTSVLQFLELWTGVSEPNISAWRRRMSGDLTGCFDFTRTRTTIPSLPDTRALRRKADQTQSKLPKPTAPAPGQQTMPKQETGTAPARPLPYQPFATLTARAATVDVQLGNAGSAPLQLQVYDAASADAVAQRVDVVPGDLAETAVTWAGAYDVAVHGPNGFLAEALGSAATSGIEVAVAITGTDAHPTLRVTFTKSTPGAVDARVSGLSAGGPTRNVVITQGSRSVTVDPSASHGWYDVTVTLPAHAGYRRRYAGHLENGRASVTG